MKISPSDTNRNHSSKSSINKTALIKRAIIFDDPRLRMDINDIVSGNRAIVVRVCQERFYERIDVISIEHRQRLVE